VSLWSWPFVDPEVLHTTLQGGLVVLVAVTLVWGLSLLLRDAGIADVFWGTGFAILAVFYAASFDGASSRTALVVGMALVWGMRLSIHIYRRGRGKSEDPRYAAWREAAGDSFWWRSYFTVFLLQGCLMWVISAPLAVAEASAIPSALTFWDLSGLAVWLAGFLFETVGDAQLSAFKADPANRGKVLDTGLWAWTRHPNYFGDALVWWGFFLVSLSVPGGAWTIFSPVLMTFLLVRVSGVSLLEKGLKESKPGYADYVARTSAFFPRPPLRGSD
jgi:steroid 5-alpha reductase family enzyme